MDVFCPCVRIRIQADMFLFSKKISHTRHRADLTNGSLAESLPSRVTERTSTEKKVYSIEDISLFLLSLCLRYRRQTPHSLSRRLNLTGKIFASSSYSR